MAKGPEGFKPEEVVRYIINEFRPSESTKDTLRMTGYGLYAMSRWVLASILHPLLHLRRLC